MESEGIILVTGFGPFGQHKINASWEAVKLLKDLKIHGYKIIVEEIEVSYNFIEKNIQSLWDRYKPKLVVHVGVSQLAKEITIETQANRTGYIKKDCQDKLHPTGVTCDSGQNCILTGIDASSICDNMKECELKFCTSSNAGRYLCEFLFYKSLNIDPNRTLFVHVPMLDNPYSVEKLSEGIIQIIEGAIKQIYK